MTSRKRSSREDVFDDGAYSQSKKTKISSSSSSTQHEGSSSKIDANGDRYWEISKMRRVTVSSFREKMMVSVREYYEKDGQELPGKKGISMPVDQFASLITLLPEIENALKQHGQSLPRPDYADGGGQLDEGDDGGHERSEGRERSTSKQNIEATSDEDESEA